MDIQDLIPKIIMNITINGQVRPTVYAQLDTGSAQAFPLMHFAGDGRMKAHLLFAEGREAGQRHLERELIETILVTEVWLTRDQRNPNPGEKPPEHIQQKEAVMFAVAANSEPFQTRVRVYEMKRDKKDKVKELVYLSEFVDPQGLMGLAFIAGWSSRLLSDEEVRQKQPLGMRAFLR